MHDIVHLLRPKLSIRSEKYNKERITHIFQYGAQLTLPSQK